jgi:hypothetical protein
MHKIVRLWATAAEGATVVAMASPSDKRKQKTDKGLEIPVPTKGDFDAAMSKVAPPADRKRPGGKDRPQKRSG